jgi:two-component system response regulator HydG
MKTEAPAEIIGSSPPMRKLLDLIGIIAPKDVKVLIRGERGTGKELVADRIHGESQRNKMPLIKINCAALGRDLFASQLFGHVKGSFTGATSTRTGLILEAHGGTLFVDEIGDLSLEAQGALLRFLQQGEVRPIGSLQTFKVDVRIISATNKDLEQAMRDGIFREDLYDRLTGFTLTVPPLRNRSEDIPDLISHFIEKYNLKYDENVSSFTKEAIQACLDYAWKGNVRELENLVSNAVILSQGRSRVGKSQVLDLIPGFSSRSLMSPQKEKILKMVKDRGRISIKDLRPALRMPDRTIRSHLHHLVNSGLLEKQGVKKNTSYTLA